MACVIRNRLRATVIGALIGVSAAGLILSGCNTVEGIGEDVSAAGQGLADVAADTNPENK